MASTDRGTTSIFIHAESTITPAVPTVPNTNQGWYGMPVSVTWLESSDIGASVGVSFFIHAESKISPASTLTPFLPSTSDGIYIGVGQGFGTLDISTSINLGATQRFGAFPGTTESLNQTFSITYPPYTTVGGSSGPTHFLMQAYESGGSCSGNVERVWLATGSSPDLTAAQYTGPRCTPTPGTFSNFSVIFSW